MISKHQSRVTSAVETLINAATGYALAIGVNYYLIPLVYPGTVSTVRGSVGLTFVFTGLSMVRTYVLRRAFVRWERNQAEKYVRAEAARRITETFHTQPDRHRY